MMTLLLVAVLALKLGQQAMMIANVRASSLGASFSIEAQWIAQGIAEQYLLYAGDPSVSWEKLLARSEIALEGYRVEVFASSVENKISVERISPDRWVALWRQNNPGFILIDNPRQALIESGYTALECLLDPRTPSGELAYLAAGGSIAPADMLTVWGDGRVDLNRAPRQVLAAVLEKFTDAEIDAILRKRTEVPITSVIELSQELKLSAARRQTLEAFAAFHPRHLQLVMLVHQGQMRAMYHAVIDLTEAGRILEVRVIR